MVKLECALCESPDSFDPAKAKWVPVNDRPGTRNGGIHLTPEYIASAVQAGDYRFVWYPPDGFCALREVADDPAVPDAQGYVPPFYARDVMPALNELLAMANSGGIDGKYAKPLANVLALLAGRTDVVALGYRLLELADGDGRAALTNAEIVKLLRPSVTRGRVSD